MRYGECIDCKNFIPHVMLDVCHECDYMCNYEEKRMTNGDRIRAMTDEELADFLGWRSLCGQIQIDHYEVCETRGVCGGCVLNWLKQPAEVKE